MAVVVFVGIGEIQSHSSLDQPLAPFRSGFLLHQAIAVPTAEDSGLSDG